MNTRSNGKYICGVYNEQLNDETVEDHPYSSAFSKALNNSLITSLKFKKSKRHIIKEKIPISKSFFQYLKARFEINCRYKKIDHFIPRFQLETKRFYLDGSSSDLVIDTFEGKISSKRPDVYYDRELNSKSTKAEYFFNYKFYKEETTAFLNGNI